MCQNTDTPFPDQQAPKIHLYAADNPIVVEEMRAFFETSRFAKGIGMA